MRKNDLIAIFIALKMCYNKQKAENLFRKILDLI